MVNHLLLKDIKVVIVINHINYRYGYVNYLYYLKMSESEHKDYLCFVFH